MTDFSFLSLKTQWNFLQPFGVTHWFFGINASTMIATWAVCIALVLTVLLCRFFFRQKNTMACFFITTGIKSFMDLCTQTLNNKFHYGHFSFVTALFLFILFCNIMGVVPFLEEPTSDLNTTLALGTVMFIYINYYAIQTHGIRKYIGEYFEPFFLMFPLNVVGKVASIISISFRLFGNLLGGSVITRIFMGTVGSFTSLWLAFIPLIGAFLSVGVYLFFGIFEGFIQAFVFAMLSLTYLSTEIAQED